MPTQFHVPVPPEGAEEINAVVARVRARGQVAYFASGVPVFVHADDDPVGQRIAAEASPGGCHPTAARGGSAPKESRQTAAGQTSAAAWAHGTA